MYRSLGAILTDAEGILLPQDAKVDVTLLDSPVQGLEFYQPGTATDYTEKLVRDRPRRRSSDARRGVRRMCDGDRPDRSSSSTPRHLSTGHSSVLLQFVVGHHPRWSAR